MKKKIVLFLLAFSLSFGIFNTTSLNSFAKEVKENKSNESIVINNKTVNKIDVNENVSDNSLSNNKEKNKEMLSALESSVSSNNINDYLTEEEIEELRKESEKNGKIKITLVTETDEEIEEKNALEESIRKEYAYEGEDYIYAKIRVDEKEYSISRKEYADFLIKLQDFAILESYYEPLYEEVVVPSEITEILEKGSNSTWEKEPSDFSDWTDEQWNEYYRYASNFTEPSEWQLEMLKYYSLTEIFAYYMNYGYYIDEAALSEKIEYDKLLSENPMIEEEIKEKRMIPYKEIVIYKNLDEAFPKEEVYCVNRDENYRLNDVISSLDEINEETELDIYSKEKYRNNCFSFELANMENNMTTYKGLGLSESQKIISYLQKYHIKDKEAITKSCYQVKVCTRIGDSPIYCTYHLIKEDFFEMITLFFQEHAVGKDMSYNYIVPEYKDVENISYDDEGNVIIPKG